jgi:hypothetical protein
VCDTLTIIFGTQETSDFWLDGLVVAVKDSDPAIGDLLRQWPE